MLFATWIFYCYKYEYNKYRKPFLKDYLKHLATIDNESVVTYTEQEFNKGYEESCSHGYTFGWTSAQCFGLLFYMLGDLYLAFGALCVVEYSIKWWIRRDSIPSEIQKIKARFQGILKH
jgi:hypothetical protein